MLIVLDRIDAHAIFGQSFGNGRTQRLDLRYPFVILNDTHDGNLVMSIAPRLQRYRFRSFLRIMLCPAVLLSGLAGSATSGGPGSDDYGPLPPIGSRDVSIADPLVSHPATTPCEVTLFDDLTFDDFSPRAFDVAPPADCPGPWAKVVLAADFSVTAGVQFDRTSLIWIGGVNVFFGTTAEPSSALAPDWHVERDLTDYSALLAGPEEGRVLIGNLVNGTYTGVIHGTAKLEFYPVPAGSEPPEVPDQVVALGADPLGATVDLSSSTDLLSKTLTLPTNIESAYLDVFAEAQGSDEFFWTCMPDNVASITGDCPGTSFREVEIAIDGQPAGVAPIYPWIYTGGVQPLLWQPIPGLQTMNFAPYRIDVTPFVALLDDGQPHTVTLGVFNVHEHFSTTAVLLLHLDAGSAQVTGELTTNSLAAAPTPVVSSTIGSNGLGTATVTSNREFQIAGYVETSHGRIDTALDQTFAYSSQTTYTSTQETFAQSTTVDSTTTVTTEDTASTTTRHEQLAYPFAFLYSNAAIDSSQSLQRLVSIVLDGAESFRSMLDDTVTSHHQSAAASRHSEQDYEYSDSAGACYSRDITSASNKLATVTDGAPCLILADTIFANGFE
jgi:Peptide N-acetyl-beta-D-glucosaminyl asparaginase amidase A